MRDHATIKGVKQLAGILRNQYLLVMGPWCLALVRKLAPVQVTSHILLLTAAILGIRQEGEGYPVENMTLRQLSLGWSWRQSQSFVGRFSLQPPDKGATLA